MGHSVAIVGGGIIGMSVAWKLAQAGFAVTVFEKSTIGGEASWAGAGMLAPGGEFEDDSKLARWAIKSRDLYPAFVEDLQRDSGLPIDFQETGALELAYSSEDLDQLAQRVQRQAAIGIPSRRLSPDQILIFWPHLKREHLSGGYFYPGDAVVNPRDVMAALQVACSRSGVHLAERTEIESIQLLEQHVLVDGHSYGAAVVAGGAWSGEIVVRGAPALPASHPVRGHLLGYHQPEKTCHTILRRGHTYLLQRANGLLIVGATVERVGFDRRVDKMAAAQLESEAAQIMPHLEETSPSEVWNGFRPGSDEVHIGQWHSKHLYLAYGHYRNGILLAPLTACLLTAEISANLQKP